MDLQTSIIENNFNEFKVLCEHYPLISSTLELICSLERVIYLDYLINTKKINYELITESCIDNCLLIDSVLNLKKILFFNLPITINILKKCVQYDSIHCFAYFCELGFKPTCEKSKMMYKLYCNIHSSTGFEHELTKLKFYKNMNCDVSQFSKEQKEKIFNAYIYYNCAYDKKIFDDLTIDIEMLIDNNRLDILKEINLDSQSILKCLQLSYELGEKDYFKHFIKNGIISVDILTQLTKTKLDYFIMIIENISIIEFRKYDLIFFELLEYNFIHIVDMNIIFWRERLFIYERYFSESDKYNKLYQIVKNAREDYELTQKNSNMINDIKNKMISVCDRN